MIKTSSSQQPSPPLIRIVENVNKNHFLALAQNVLSLLIKRKKCGSIQFEWNYEHSIIFSSACVCKFIERRGGRRCRNRESGKYLSIVQAKRFAESASENDGCVD